MIKTVSTVFIAMTLPLTAMANGYIQATLGGATKGDAAMPYVASGTIGRHLTDNLSLELDVSMSLGEAYGRVIIDDTVVMGGEDQEAKLMSASMMLARFIPLSERLCTDMYIKTGLAYRGFEEEREWSDPLHLKVGPSLGVGLRYGLRENSDLVADLTHIDGNNRITFGISKSF